MSPLHVLFSTCYYSACCVIGRNRIKTSVIKKKKLSEKKKLSFPFVFSMTYIDNSVLVPTLLFDSVDYVIFFSRPIVRFFFVFFRVHFVYTRRILYTQINAPGEHDSIWSIRLGVLFFSLASITFFFYRYSNDLFFFLLLSMGVRVNTTPYAKHPQATRKIIVPDLLKRTRTLTDSSSNSCCPKE